MTTIRYFVPEDGDLETEPNVFLAPKSRHPNSPPSFGQIRDAFPLPGQYHFRFKSALVPGTDRDKSAMAVWMDVVEERQPVPTWRGSIVVKVSRVSMEDDEDDDDDEDFHRPTAAAPAPVAATPAPKPPPSHGSSVGSAGSIDDLFGTTTTTTPTPAPASGGGSLLDFNDHHHHAPAAAAAAHNDFLGMTAHPPVPAASGIKSAPTSGGYHGNPNMYAQQQQQQQQQHIHMQQQQHMRQQQYGGYGQQQQPQGGGGAFGDLQWS